MSQNGIRYTDEFKKQLVDLYQTGSSVSYLSREYGVSNVTIYKWIKELSPVKVSEKEEITSKEYDIMKKRIAELEMENEILKKLPPYSQENDRRDRYLHRKIQINLYCKTYMQSLTLPQKYLL